MSSIESYNHKLLGFIKCESDYDLVYNNSTRMIAVYKLEQNIPQSEKEFDGNVNDILVGGGSGEVPVFRISYPKAFKFFHQTNFDDFGEYDNLFKAFWSPTDSFKLCNGFMKYGYHPNQKIEFWLAEQVCNVLSNNFTEYSEFVNHKFKRKITFTKHED